MIAQIALLTICSVSLVAYAPVAETPLIVVIPDDCACPANACEDDSWSDACIVISNAKEFVLPGHCTKGECQSPAKKCKFAFKADFSEDWLNGCAGQLFVTFSNQGTIQWGGHANVNDGQTFSFGNPITAEILGKEKACNTVPKVLGPSISVDSSVIGQIGWIGWKTECVDCVGILETEK
jgi:hypothetical protein